jgi:hypothetical protein
MPGRFKVQELEDDGKIISLREYKNEFQFWKNKKTPYAGV